MFVKAFLCIFKGAIFTPEKHIALGGFQLVFFPRFAVVMIDANLVNAGMKSAPADDVLVNADLVALSRIYDRL